MVVGRFPRSLLPLFPAHPIRAFFPAEGLKQALAATEIFYGSNLDSLDVKSTILALNAVAPSSSPSHIPIPSALVRLPSSEVIGNSLSHLVISSGLISSKSQFWVLWHL